MEERWTKAKEKPLSGNATRSHIGKSKHHGYFNRDGYYRIELIAILRPTKHQHGWAKMFEHLSENLARDPDYLDRLIHEDEAARFLGYTTRCLQNWRVRGGGPKFVKVSGRSIRYRRRDLITWAEAHLVESTSAAD